MTEFIYSLTNDDTLFLIGHFVEEDDDHWSCFLLLWDICSIVCSPCVTKDDSLSLAWFVQMYIESFKYLYGERHITPKMHHLAHLPEQIIM